MAQMWPGSLIPWTDENGDPYVGARVEFFDANTTTPQVVYTDSSLSTAAGLSARTANARGQFGALFLNPDPGDYRVRITDADGSVIWDVDGISVPQDANYSPPDAGETDPTLLNKTGFLQPYYGTTAPAGWVRANGRTIGSATSGATERANADCEDLFKHLWDQDSNLAVSGGRGANAASDWAANKTIALPSLRGRTFVGLDTMGNTAAGVLTGIETLGETTGAASVALSVEELPSHAHGNGTLKAPNHGHPFRLSVSNDEGDSRTTGGLDMKSVSNTNYPAFTGTPSTTAGEQIGGSGDLSLIGSMASVGSGLAHPNVQPSMGVTIIIKL